MNVRFLAQPFGFAEGFDHFLFDPENGIIADVTVNNAIDWLREELHSQTDEDPVPLFMFIHLWDVHAPYDPPSPYGNYFTDQIRETACKWDVGENDEVLNTGDLNVFLARYDGCISYVDYQL